MTTPIIDNAFDIEDSHGRPVPGGKVYTYEQGTTTPKVTYSDEAGTIPNTNPVILDSSGRAMIFGEGAYTIDAKDMFDTQVSGWPKDINLFSLESQVSNLDKKTVKKVSTISDLRALTDISNDDATIVLGETSSNDGAGGPVRVGRTGEPPGTFVDNGTSIILPNGGDGSEAWITSPIALFYDEVRTGKGSTLPQPNAAFQSVRDHSVGNGFSTHGFIVSDFFAVDTSAMNCFGSDVEVGDGTHDASLLINHLNAFQTRDIMELGLGTLESYGTLITFSELRSGLLERYSGVTLIDPLGQTDTPGIQIPNFEVNGPAQINNSTGISTVIKHGLNPRSAYFSAGVNDALAKVSTGGAPVDIECPTIIREVAPTTTKTSGALVLTDGGIGCDGAIFAGDEMSVVSSAPILRFRNAGNTTVSYMQYSGTALQLLNSGPGDVGIGNNGASKVIVKADRFIPNGDDALFLGDGTNRWKQLFAVTATINTSDESEKEIIGNIPDELLDAWGNVQHYLFKWRDAVSEKGDAARTHAGLIAQQIQKVLYDAGFNGFDYGLLCEDELTEEVTKIRTEKQPVMITTETEQEVFTEDENGALVRTLVPVISEEQLMRDAQVMNPDGSPYLVDSFEIIEVNTGTEDKPRYEKKEKLIKCPMIKKIPVMKDVDVEYTETVKSGVTRMGLRYGECMIIEAAYLRREISRLKDS